MSGGGFKGKSNNVLTDSYFLLQVVFGPLHKVDGIMRKEDYLQILHIKWDKNLVQQDGDPKYIFKLVLERRKQTRLTFISRRSLLKDLTSTLLITQCVDYAERSDLCKGTNQFK